MNFKRIMILMLLFSASCLYADSDPVRTVFSGSEKGQVPQSAKNKTQRYDVVIYGGTSAAVTAAVQVRRMGKSTAIVCPEKHLGGLTVSGLGFTDSGNKAVIGGIAREFYHRLWLYYDQEENWTFQKKPGSKGMKGQSGHGIDPITKTVWIFEPHAASRIFRDFLNEYKIPVFKNEYLDRENGVLKKDQKILSIKMMSGKIFQADMFLDTTYEGDLMAAAGISYHVGREPNSLYGEIWNGNQVGIYHHRHWFAKKISPYCVPNDPKSGRIPYIDASEPGIRGTGDDRIQAYCFRLCMSDHPKNRVPFVKPDHYDPKNYELLRRLLDAGWRELFNKYDRIPNQKTDTNNHGPFSMDFIGMNYRYPEASYSEREKIVKEHEEYQRGLLYFLQNDPGVPKDVREKMSVWGLAKDEFTDNGNWPWQIYVREARRMIGEYVVTENDCFGKEPDPSKKIFAGMKKYGSAGRGSYALDSHNVRRYITPEGFVQNEGDIGVSPKKSYPVDYGALVPKRSECVNLLVPVCVSSSHIAFGSIRMEPVFMILGQSAATAACLAMDQNIPVQNLKYEDLSARLKKDGQILEHPDKSKRR
ncbi:MAG: FAD-dependent oxidoreductase [Planctomycetia bacterium]|nr:FAD-dependent oxidoreductase [Planctomycetia bacterium]